MLRDAISRFGDTNSEQKAIALLRSALVEIAATRLNDALRIFSESASLFEASSNHALKGKFHVNLATTLKNLGISENRQDYTDRALIEYAAASFHFERAGHMSYRAAVENNLGSLFFTNGKFIEAHKHLERARKLFDNLKDEVHCAQVDETRARTFLVQGRNVDAEKAVRSAIRILERGDEQALLAEALTTYGAVLGRLGKHQQAQPTLQRAIEVAYQAGDLDGAGLAALTIIEEVGQHLTLEELRLIYQRADALLSKSQHLATLARLRSCAGRIITFEQAQAQEFNAPNFIYVAEPITKLLRDAHRIANSPVSVLITGETGTGKEVLARMIHDWSNLVGQFVVINCGALPDDLIESQLFGHLRSSFTDAVADHPGAVKQASGGTLFLDEIGELGINHQAKLLRLVENGEIHSLGAPLPEHVNVRIIAATNRDLKELIARKRFRDDLFYRLCTFELEIPPLRERPEDIPILAEHFIKEFTDRHRKDVRFTPEAIEATRKLPLKGNVRELRTLIERTVLIAENGVEITAEAIETIALRQTQMVSFANPWEHFSLKEEVLLFEERIIALALKEAKGRVTHAARLLGFHNHSVLQSRLKTRNKNVQSGRKPAEKRRRSIIRY